MFEQFIDFHCIFRGCMVTSGEEDMEITKLHAWELCRWLTSIQTRGRKRSLWSLWQRILFSNTSASSSGQSFCEHMGMHHLAPRSWRMMMSLPGGRRRRSSFFSGWPTGRRWEVRSKLAWHLCPGKSYQVTTKKTKEAKFLLIVKRWEARWGKSLTTGQ